jgi:hypothetical protein
MMRSECKPLASIIILFCAGLTELFQMRAEQDPRGKYDRQRMKQRIDSAI